MSILFMQWRQCIDHRKSRTSRVCGIKAATH